MALACAPCTLTLNLHRFRMTTNGRILLLQLVLSCGMIASFVNSISPSLLFNTYWIALLMEYLPLFLGSISSRYDKNFSNFGLSSSFRLFVIYSIRFSGFEYFSAAFSSIRFEWWMISSYFCMAFASSLVFRSLLFGSSLYESLNFLKAWTLHRHRITFSTLLYPSYASDSRYPLYPFRNSFGQSPDLVEW